MPILKLDRSLSFILFITFFATSSCTHLSLSVSSAEDELRLNQNISIEIDRYYNKLMKTSPDYFDLNAADKNYETILKDLFDLKLLFVDKMNEFNSSSKNSSQCVDSTRKALRIIRYIEDYILLQ